MSKLCIGLFGTCGKSTFRKDIFIPAYEQMGLVNGVDYFNPQVDEWKPEDAVVEAQHLAEDQIILFPVTKETYGTGSLAETGFSIIQALKFDDRREIVLMIDQSLDESLMTDKVAAKESLRARALVKEHLKKITWQNVHVVDSLDEMLKWSIFLYRQKLALQDFQKYIKSGV